MESWHFCLWPIQSSGKDNGKKREKGVEMHFHFNWRPSLLSSGKDSRN